MPSGETLDVISTKLDILIGDFSRARKEQQ